MINRFEIARKKFLRGFVDLFFDTIDKLFDLYLLRHLPIEPINPGDVRAVIKLQRWIVPEKPRDGYGMLAIEQ